ncbi:helix-turn-helix domain-containing protein [Schwartzia succinivorans]|uniref:Helix-turn-helix n=1 Tax=Schwartzia succinivorans DSM 10502 TaxID=1123243 RepID=A0A1M4XD77_9FIRM|nr:helix-turn-helix transcriptional regulator [Schwartzia succinivorans]SHE91375.1 Helix-turn-helix [Schwartzia succinivorans DSM 10502]
MSTDKKMVLRQIGAKIAYFRTLVGISQRELAAKINTTQSTISKVESGNYNDNLSIVMLTEIADALEVDLSLLLEFTGYEKAMWDRKSGE